MCCWANDVDRERMINALTTKVFVAMYALFVAYNNDDDSKNAFR